MTMTSSSAADMIKRFREGKPTSRSERSKMSSKKELWWIESEEKVKSELVDDIEEPRHLSPLKPTKPPQQPQYYSRHNPSNQRKHQLRDSLVDDLIADDIEDVRFSGWRSKENVDRPVVSLYSSKEKFLNEGVRESLTDKSRFISRPHHGAEHMSLFRSDHRPEYSVDTIGSIGRNGLLAPHLKLDGKKDVPSDGPNLEDLMRSLEYDSNRQHNGSDTLVGVYADLNCHMQTFTAAFDEKYAKEAAEAAERAERDAKMREEGRLEERARAIADFQYFKSIAAKTSTGKNDDNLISDPIPENDSDGVTTVEEPVRKTATSRHGLYDRSLRERELENKINAAHVSPDAVWLDSPYRDQADDSLLYSHRARNRRLDALYALHMLDPPAAWISRPSYGQVESAPAAAKKKLDSCPGNQECEVSDENVLSEVTLRHCTISHAVENIESTLNVALACLHLRLPPSAALEESTQPVATALMKDAFTETKSTDEEDATIAHGAEGRQTDTPIEPGPQQKDPVVAELPPTGNSIGPSDLEMLDKMLGENGIDLVDTPRVFQQFGSADSTDTKHAQPSRRVINFHTLDDVEKVLRRDGPSNLGHPGRFCGDRTIKSTYSLCTQPRTTWTPHSAQYTSTEPSAPQLSLNHKIRPPARELAANTEHHHGRLGSGLHALPRDDNFMTRHKYLQDMRMCRYDFEQNA